MLPKARDHALYSDGVDRHSVQFPEDNYSILSDGAAVFEKPISEQWIHSEMNVRQGEFLRKEKVLGRTKDDNGDETV